ncbi:MAG: response regulator [Chloroflexota bacterium]
MARIVLAEDDATMARLLGTLLRMDGYDVMAVDGDADVAAAVERLAPDALVLDMIFAQQNGLELVERIRHSKFGAKLYIIMISGLSVRDECLRSGADDFLLKPFMPDELVGLLRTHLPSAT